MFRIHLIPALILGSVMTLSGCVGSTEVTRNAPLALAPMVEVPTASWGFAGLQITVPETITVSEANTIKPRADIVWREDPPGDRRAQVQDLMQSALEPVLSGLTGDVPVQFDIELRRFHALTQRARYTIGGEHEITFILTARHAETGALLTGPREVVLDFRAFGGRQAVEAEAQGITQAVRITGRLQDWAREEFPRVALGLGLS